jgi:hypothetical protein
MLPTYLESHGMSWVLQYIIDYFRLQDLMCCRDVYGVALFVHKCMKIADAAAVAAAMQQLR